MCHNRNVSKQEIWELFIVFEEGIGEDFIEEVTLTNGFRGLLRNTNGLEDEKNEDDCRVWVEGRIEN